MNPFPLPTLEAFSQQTTIHISPSDLVTFWEAFTPVFEKTSSLPECLYFEVFEDPAEPGKITWVVNWNASPEWVMSQFKQEYYAPYLAATEPLFTQPREVRFLKREEDYVAGKRGNFERGIGEGNQGLSLHVAIEIDSKDVPKFKEEWAKIFPLVAEEPECLYFEVFSSPTHPGKLSWIENWSKGPEWFMQEQMTKEYYKPYLAATELMFTAPRVFTLLKRKEGFVRWKEANFEGSTVGEFRG